MALKKLNWAPAKADIVKQSSEIISPEINEAIASLSESERADYEERAEAERRALERILAKRGNLNGTETQNSFSIS